MAFRGRGRGRGYGGAGGYGFAKQEPFELFPDIELPNIKSVHKEETLVRESVKLQNFWKASAYYLDETVSKSSKGQRPSQKKVRWNPESELQKLDYLEKLEQRAQGQENKDEKEKKEGENEDEDENDGEEDIEEEPSDDDYFQNVEFDDDDDDFNDVDDGGEGIFL
ncbi:hypothetical protein I3842_Q030100 [Carya illinoinensis]|uniref:DNA-directed RNA polymerase III subunit n=1 Tax=Carya illinoinensis TaxID=32201 RepID=A0A922D0I3_CARIL|nr:hypothetical protein I3842_Q030100 [Carya illinoinensis]